MHHAPRTLSAILAAMVGTLVGCGGGGSASFNTSQSTVHSLNTPVNGSFTQVTTGVTSNGANAMIAMTASYDGTVTNNGSVFGLPMTVALDGATVSTVQLAFTIEGSTSTGTGTGVGTGTGGGTGTGVGVGGGGSGGGGIGGFGGSAIRPVVQDSGGVGGGSVGGGGGTVGSGTGGGSVGGSGGQILLTTAIYAGSGTVPLTHLSAGSHTVVITFGSIPGFTGSVPASVTMPLMIAASGNG